MSANSPAVSVIINAFNGEQYLRQAIESVYAQSFSDFEIVLYDDASTDSTPDIARSFDSRLRFVRSDQQVPLGEARNRAVAASRGKFLSFLDQDDLFLPLKLERQVERFRGDVALVFCNSVRFWEKNGKEELLYRRRPHDGDAFRELLRGYYLSINTVMIRRDALPEDPRWWFPASFGMCEEVDLFLRLAHRYPIAYVDEVLARYRIHGDNWTIRHPEQLVTERIEMMERLASVIPNFSNSYARELASLRSQIDRVQAQIDWRNGRRSQALAGYQRSLRLDLSPVAFAEMALCAIFPYSILPRLRQCLGRPI